MGYATGGIFQFGDHYFRQIDGVTMGSPLGPTLANIVLAHLEKEWQKLEFSPHFYARYVDDIICIFNDHSKLDLFFNLLTLGILI